MELGARWRQHRLLHAYVELAAPSLAQALSRAAAIAPRVIVLPFFLFAAGHIKNDLPLELFRARAQFGNVEFFAANALGVHPGMVGAALDRLNSAPVRTGRRAIVVVGRGSSDPDANGDFVKLVRLLGEAAGVPWTFPAFIGITDPRFDDALEFVARSRPDEITVLPYFLFAGRLIMQLKDKLAQFGKRHSWISISLAPHLGAHTGLFRALEDRLGEALFGDSRLPCDNCQYRVPISAVNNVGGLRALLWSVRHTLTHNQAMPHTHAHRTMRKHVLVCGNADCASRGSVMLISTLRRQIAQAGRDRDIRVTVTGCMGRCGEGPTVAVYPDGIWYRGVKADDVTELVEEHLMHDRLVPRLIDGIMQ